MAKEVTLWSNSGFDDEEEPNSWIIALQNYERIHKKWLHLTKNNRFVIQNDFRVEPGWYESTLKDVFVLSTQDVVMDERTRSIQRSSIAE